MAAKTRRFTGAATALLFLAALAACGGSNGPAASSSTNGQVSEDLTFSGAPAGHMTSAHRGDMYVCAGSGSSYVAGPIVGSLGGREVDMNITKISFRGAGSYPAGGVSFDLGSDHYYPSLGNPGTLVVATDLRSGTVDIELAVNSDPNTVVGRVTGTWRCPPDAL